MLLASAGVKVKIFERMPIVGGRTSTLQAEGFKFDLGPTFFLYPSGVGGNFRHGRGRPPEEVELVRLDPQYRIIFGAGGELQATPDIARMEQQIARHRAEDAPGFRNFLEENRFKLDRMLPCLENPFLGWGDVLNMRLLKMLPMLRPHQSVDTYLCRFFQRPTHPSGFLFPVEISGHVAVPVPEPVFDSIVSGVRVWRFPPDRGCAAVTAAMARVAERLGVEIRSERTCGRDFLRGRRAIGVRTRAESSLRRCAGCQCGFCTRDVPAGAGPVAAPVDGSQNRPEEILVLDVHDVSRESRADSICRIITSTSADYYARNLDEIENRHVLSEDPSFYVQNACVTDSDACSAAE